MKNSEIRETSSKSTLQYELRVHKCDLKPEEYVTIPLDSDIVLYAVYYGNKQFTIYYNDDCVFGCFYLPFVYTPTNDYSSQIKHLLQQINMHNKISVCLDIIIHVYESQDSQGRKFAAIGATNKQAKSDDIKKLNVQTLSLQSAPVDPFESWLSCCDELLCDPTKSKITEIELSDILEFETRQVVVHQIKHLLIPKKIGWRSLTENVGLFSGLLLQSPESPFYAIHIDCNSADYFFDKEQKCFASIYKTKVYRMTSMEEINKNIKTMIESFRVITGFTRCRTFVQYCEISPSIYDVSISTFAKDIDSFVGSSIYEEEIVF